MEKKSNAGFSLIEILIVVAIAASVVIVVSNLNSNVGLLNGFVSQQLESKSDIVQTLQIMTTEVRSAGLSGSGAYPIDAASTSSFSFYSDIDKNGSVEHVRYFLASSTLYKGVTEPSSSEVVTDAIDYITSPTTSTPLFSYYGVSYTGSQQALTYPINVSDIRLVEVSFAADVKPSQAPGPEYFSTFIDIRNLRSN